MSITISPGDTFYDKLPDGRYEKCVLQQTTNDTPDRHAAARGGTGEFFRAIPKDELRALLSNPPPCPRLDAAVMIYDTDGLFVHLEPVL
jgi:hypothetical protein